MTLTNRQKEALNIFSANQYELNSQSQSGARDSVLTGSDASIRLGDVIEDLQNNSGGATGTTSEVILAVTTSGTDRETSILGGDYSASPFLTLQAALNNLPNHRDYDVTVNVGSGSFAGAAVPPWSGRGKLKIFGTTSVATLTTGDASGTAGTGTTSTSLVKPNSSANWTVNNLQGKRLKITGGGGYDSTNPNKTYPIKSNTTTAASVDTITGMDSTTTFQIVTLPTILTSAASQVRSVTCCIGSADSVGDLIIENVAINDVNATQGAYFSNNGRLTLSGCDIYLAVYSGVGIYDTDNLAFERNYIAGPNAFAEIIGGSRMTGYRTVLANSRLLIQDYRDARGWVESQTSSVNSLKLISVADARWALNATSCTATPLYLDNTQFKIIDAGLTGTNSGAPYGVEVYNGSLFYATGATISGANDVQIEDQTVSWATIALGAYEVRSSNVVWGAGSQRIGSEFAGLSDVTAGGILKMFGFMLAADNGSATNSAFLSSLTAYASGGQANAPETGYIATIVNTATALNASVKYRASAKGEISLIWNTSATNIALFPPSTGSINGNPANSSITITAGALAIGISTSGVDYRVKVIA